MHGWPLLQVAGGLGGHGVAEAAEEVSVRRAQGHHRSREPPRRRERAADLYRRGGLRREGGIPRDPPDASAAAAAAAAALAGVGGPGDEEGEGQVETGRGVGRGEPARQQPRRAQERSGRRRRLAAFGAAPTAATTRKGRFTLAGSSRGMPGRSRRKGRGAGVGWGEGGDEGLGEEAEAAGRRAVGGGVDVQAASEPAHLSRGGGARGRASGGVGKRDRKLEARKREVGQSAH